MNKFKSKSYLRVNLLRKSQVSNRGYSRNSTINEENQNYYQLNPKIGLFSKILSQKIENKNKKEEEI